MSRLRMAVVGVGHLGKEHARILAGLPGVELVGVADINFDQAQTVARRHGSRAFADYWPLLNLVDAAVVAVPTTHHHEIARAFLRRHIPLLVEKPLALSLPQAEDLVELALRHETILQVGHIERFNPALEELENHPLQPKFVECQRLGPYSGRSTDIGAVLDLMIHDLDLLLALVQAPVRSVEALGVTLFGRHEDVANARLVFGNGCVANLTASRASAVPVRRMHVWAPEGYAGLDFAQRSLTLVQPSEQLRRHGLGLQVFDPANLSKLPREMFGQHLQVLKLDRAGGDQLTRELEHFIQSVQTGTRPRVSGVEGRDALALAALVLEKIQGHQWEGRAEGPTGPLHPPEPLGPLFDTPKEEAA
ncbi:MAG: Gfo/Idh/MocA family oxidoreductase [Planctomycetes bacterium]|nr:Gfo/Idh/MocA family oxidoreductase [Planctomycetota bacterium]